MAHLKDVCNCPGLAGFHRSSMKRITLTAVLFGALIKGAIAATAPAGLSYTAPSGTYNQIAVFSSLTPSFTTAGSPNPTYSVTSGQLPAGVSLNANNGTIGGSPMVTGTFSGIVITATNSAGNTSYSLPAFTVNSDAAYTSGWSGSQIYGMNPKSTGITTNQANFPVLIRLTTANAAIFSAAAAGGADLRFAKSANTNVHYPYQIEHWSATNDSAEIWVLVDTVFAALTGQGITMYWGNGSATAASSGPAVFSPGNGFAAVYHFAEGALAKGGTILDATGQHNALDSLTPTGLLGTGSIGLCHQWNAADIINTGVWTPTLNHQLTLSAWVYPTNAGNETVIAQRGNWDATDHWDFFCKSSGSSHWYPQVYANTNANNPATQTLLNNSTWYYIAVATDSASTSQAYSNGVANGGTVSNAWGTNQTSVPITIGTCQAAKTEEFAGYMDEARIESVLRPADWIKLCYSNQVTSQTFIAPAVAPTSLSYSNTSQTFTQLTLITSMSPTVGGSPSPAVSYAVSSGGLPTGVLLNAATGVIAGTPMIPGTFSAVINASNLVGSVTATISGTVNADATYAGTWTNAIDFFMNPSATGYCDDRG